MSSYYEKIIATGEVKCIDEEIPFEIPKSWEWARFSTIVNMSPNVFAEDDENAAFMPMALINAGYGSGYSYETKQWKLIKKGFTKMAVGDIAFAKITPCFQNRKSFILGDVPGKVAATTTELNVLRIYGQTLSAWYVLYFLKSDYFIKYAKYKGTAGQQRVLSSYIQNKLFPIPSYNEQFRIVEKIQGVLPIVDKYEKLQNELDKINVVTFDKLKKSILQEAIQGKLVPQITEEGTAQELLEQIMLEKQKLVKEGKLKRSILNNSIIYKGDDNKYYEQIGKKCWDITEQIPFEIPSNWEWCRVRNVSNSYIGLTYKPTDIDEKGTIVLRSCNIRNGKLALDDIVRVSSSISEKMLIEENDIIICARNGSKRLVGKSALIKNLPEPMTFGAFMAICKTPIYEYMFAYLQSDLFFGQLRDVSNTTTINQLTQNKFNDFLIPIPPVREQERIAFKISQLFQELR
ncbi:restriction endonuclease subunit S [Prevotella marseillensis]|uniref:restriction endonuclease subunit S n=1 Tax=Prevotella marseillensis TaxID=2479840 RepID=UPI000F62F31F|nr:restriction endonuclease subunit S [Prevotella marseillensis]